MLTEHAGSMSATSRNASRVLFQRSTCPFNGHQLGLGSVLDGECLADAKGHVDRGEKLASEIWAIVG